MHSSANFKFEVTDPNNDSLILMAGTAYVAFCYEYTPANWNADSDWDCEEYEHFGWKIVSAWTDEGKDVSNVLDDYLPDDYFNAQIREEMQPE